ncbi:hypothetical protein O181_061978 [Austropuccinia psidii MF-1]|uniref:Uncharacterized protein n=1 Tax=Austropuccinia psidii MF-1 TaxID=1389203 RepID=A0A9Q3HZ31_9BASI|nr:hypothetical protein [Austropuccinia psidii MF-1]
MSHPIPRDINSTHPTEASHPKSKDNSTDHNDKARNSTQSAPPKANVTQAKQQPTKSDKNDTSPQADSTPKNNQTSQANHQKQPINNTSKSTKPEDHPNLTSAQAENPSPLPISSSNNTNSIKDSSSDKNITLTDKTPTFNFTTNSTNNDTLQHSSLLPANLSSSSNSQPETSAQAELPVVIPDEQFQESHKLSKAALSAIIVVGIIAFMIIASCLFYFKKRFKKSTTFFGCRLRSSSNDSNRAVRDRSSIGNQFSLADPFSRPTPFSKKPLILRPETFSQLHSKHSTNSRRPSLLNIPVQSLKSQISSPIIEPPSPAIYRSFSGASLPKSPSCVSPEMTPLSTQFPSTPSRYQYQEYSHDIRNVYPLDGGSSTKDQHYRRDSLTSMRDSNIEADGTEEDVDPQRNKQILPSRPYRPELQPLSLNPLVIKHLPNRTEKISPIIPVTRPLNVSRRSHPSRAHNHQHSSLDMNILEPPDLHNFLPQYQHEEKNPFFSSDLQTELARISHLSHSTCYSQPSEPGNLTGNSDSEPIT